MKKILLYFLFFCFLLLIYKNWFFSPEIIGGDWPFFYPENVRDFSFLPAAWSSIHGNGLGGPHVVYALDSYLYFTGWFFTNTLHIPWNFVYKIFWFGLTLVLSIFSVNHLLKQLFPNMPLHIRMVGMFLFLVNTYILMVLGGGQLGVGLGYAIAPLVLSFFIRVISVYGEEQAKKIKFDFKNISRSSTIYTSILAGLALSVDVLFDFRITYITLLAIGIYYVFHFNKTFSQFFYIFLIPFLLTGLLHAFWLIPLLFTGQNSVAQLGSAYTSVESLKFFSFAMFENAFGLLHPNWPENIFGKVAFMKPEFLLLPLLAFSSLIFISQKKADKNSGKKNVLFFAFLALVGIFLAKGANDPFGDLYIWLFENVPGFVMFRDPSKFYTLIALSYSILIPFSLWAVLQRVVDGKKMEAQNKVLNIFPYFLLIFIILYLLFLIRPAIMVELGGTFRSRTIHQEYTSFKNVLLEDENFSRVLWFPKFQRFGYNSQMHPALESSSIFKATNSAELAKEITKSNTEKKLADLSIKYIVVPYDSEHELFLNDRKYNSAEPESYKKVLDKVPWLTKDKKFTNITVYRVKSIRDRIYLADAGTVSHKRNSSTNYSINVNTEIDNTLIFNESFSPYWKLFVNGKEIQSKRYKNVNSFDLQSINKEMQLKYTLESYYTYGRIISLITILIIFYYLIIYKRQYK